MQSKLINKHLFLLAIISGCVLAVFFIRNAVLHDDTYHFLLWNLFLGLVPLLVACAVFFLFEKLNKILIWCAGFLWLLFYPNAPYMLSDLIHINQTSSVVLYDALIIFSLSMLSVFYGFYSIKIMQFTFKRLVGNKTAYTMTTASILLSSFGIYLGRILRLNSWDLFTHPMEVLREIIDHLFPVTKNPVTYVIIILFSGIQFMLLLLMKDVDEVGEPYARTNT